MKKTLFPLVLITLGVAADAAILTPQEALEAYTTSGARRARAVGQPRLVYTVPGTAYVFDRGNNGGYLVLSAQSQGDRLIGYSDSGSLQEGEIPANMAAWLEEYRQVMEHASDVPEEWFYTSRGDASEPIEPLLTTKWSQSTPFNSMCPMVGDRRAPSGCMATAMSQIMKYYNYPAKGKGQIEYEYYNGIEWTTNTTDFSTSIYKWDLMRNEYNSTYTPDQGQAVALLLADVGAANEMNYRQVSSGGTTQPLPYGMVEFFDYDRGIQIARRGAYSAQQWDDLMIGELKAKRPVFYTGYGQDSGHAFVIDGYSGDGFFHVNWGWAGLSDGYFKLSLLNPPSLGIGGGDGDGYNGRQAAYVHVCPNHGTLEVTPSIYLNGMFTTGAKSYERREYSQVDISRGGGYGFQNNCAAVIDKIVPGLKFTSKTDATDVRYAPSSNTFYEIIPSSAYGAYRVRSLDFPVGEWIMEPAFQIGDKWYDVVTNLSAVHQQKVTVTDSEITIDADALDAELEIFDIEVPDNFYRGKDFRVAAKIKNNGAEFYGTIKLMAYENGTSQRQGPENTLLIHAGEQIESQWIGTFKNISGGKSEIVFETEDGTPLSQRIEIEVGKAPGGTPEVVATSVEMVHVDGKGTGAKPYLVDLPKLSITTEVTCTGGYYSGNVGAEVYAYTGDSQLMGLLSEQFVILNDGETRTINYEGELNDLELGKKYKVIVPFYSKSIVFKSSASGIEVIGEEQENDSEYYTLQGVKVTCETMVPGIYVARNHGESRLVVIK